MADYLRAAWLKVNFVKGYKCFIQAKTASKRERRQKSVEEASWW